MYPHPSLADPRDGPPPGGPRGAAAARHAHDALLAHVFAKLDAEGEGGIAGALAACAASPSSTSSGVDAGTAVAAAAAAATGASNIDMCRLVERAGVPRGVALCVLDDITMTQHAVRAAERRLLSTRPRDRAGAVAFEVAAQPRVFSGAEGLGVDVHGGDDGVWVPAARVGEWVRGAFLTTEMPHVFATVLTLLCYRFRKYIAFRAHIPLAAFADPTARAQHEALWSTDPLPYPLGSLPRDRVVAKRRAVRHVLAAAKGTADEQRAASAFAQLHADVLHNPFTYGFNDIAAARECLRWSVSQLGVGSVLAVEADVFPATRMDSQRAYADSTARQTTTTTAPSDAPSLSVLFAAEPDVSPSWGVTSAPELEVLLVKGRHGRRTGAFLASALRVYKERLRAMWANIFVAAAERSLTELSVPALGMAVDMAVDGDSVGGGGGHESAAGKDGGSVVDLHRSQESIASSMVSGPLDANPSGTHLKLHQLIELAELSLEALLEALEAHRGAHLAGIHLCVPPRTPAARAAEHLLPALTPSIPLVVHTAHPTTAALRLAGARGAKVGVVVPTTPGGTLIGNLTESGLAAFDMCCVSTAGVVECTTVPPKVYNRVEASERQRRRRAHHAVADPAVHASTSSVVDTTFNEDERRSLKEVMKENLALGRANEALRKDVYAHAQRVAQLEDDVKAAQQREQEQEQQHHHRDRHASHPEFGGGAVWDAEGGDDRQHQRQHTATPRRPSSTGIVTRDLGVQTSTAHLHAWAGAPPPVRIDVDAACGVDEVGAGDSDDDGVCATLPAEAVPVPKRVEDAARGVKETKSPATTRAPSASAVGEREAVMDAKRLWPYLGLEVSEGCHEKHHTRSSKHPKVKRTYPTGSPYEGEELPRTPRGHHLAAVGGGGSTLVVREVKPDGPAERAGIRPCDLILAVADRATPSLTAFFRVMQTLAPLTPVKVTVQGPEDMTPSHVSVTPAPRPMVGARGFGPVKRTRVRTMSRISVEMRLAAGNTNMGAGAGASSTPRAASKTKATGAAGNGGGRPRSRSRRNSPAVVASSPSPRGRSPHPATPRAASPLRTMSTTRSTRSASRCSLRSPRVRAAVYSCVEGSSNESMSC